MNRNCKNSLLVAALASLLTLHGSLALADSLVTTDGELLTGTVHKTASGYTIKTADGPVDLPADKVKKILFDHPQENSITDSKTATPAATPVKNPKMLKSLLAQGQAAMAGGEFSDARDAFTDALALDPNNGIAGRGLGFAYAKLGKVSKAVKPLEVAALSQPMDRSLTMALSASLVATKNPLRAVKLLKAYLETHPTPLDESVVNALGIALSQVDRSATRGTLFTGADDVYLKFNDQLNTTQPGKKRWGLEWQDGKEVDKKQKAHAAAQKTFNAASDKLQTANSQVSSAQSALTSAQSSTGNRNAVATQIRNAQNELNTATTAQRDAQGAFDVASKALADAPGPDFPRDIPLDDVDLSMNPNPAVASAVTTPQPALPDAHPKATPTPTPAPTPAAIPTPADATDPTPTPAVKPDKPEHATRYAVAFAIAPDVVVTAESAVEDATDIEITTSDGKTLKAEVLRAHHSDGLALLKIADGKLPCLALADSAKGATTLNCLGYPEVDLFNPLAKSMSATAGAQTESWTIRLDSSPRLPGGPLLADNKVVGVELGDRDSDLSAVPAATLKALLSLTEDSAHADIPAKDPKSAVVQVMAER